LEHRKVEMAAKRRGYPSLVLKGGAFRRFSVMVLLQLILFISSWPLLQKIL
jgi:hypothetical protein